jgi:hypothetical protein
VSDTETVELDEEAKRLKLEAIKAAARKEIAEAQKATLEAQLPSSDLAPLEGKVDVGPGVGLVAKLVAYELLHDGAATIVTAIGPKLRKPARVLVVEDRSLAGRNWSYAIVRAELDAQNEALRVAKEAFDAAPKPAPAGKAAVAGPVAAIPALIGAAAGLIGMFRTNYSITGKDFTIGTTPLVAAVTEKLLAVNTEVTIEHFSLLDSQIITEFEEARKARRELDRRSQEKSKAVHETDRRIADLRTLLKESSAAYPTILAEGKTGSKALWDLIESLRKDIADAEKGVAVDRALVTLGETVGARFDTFATAATASSKEGSYPPLVAAAIQERLRAEPKRYTHVLYVAVEGAGGETITRQANFIKSGVAVFMGGAQVSYLLLSVATNTTTVAGTESLLGQLRYELKNGETGPLKSVKLRS